MKNDKQQPDTGLVARLREQNAVVLSKMDTRKLLDEAADRIEELEQGLRVVRTWANCGAGDPEAELEDIVDKADKLLSASRRL